MPQFFIQRPVFAWVVAIAIALAGLIALPTVPVARFPSVAPPSVTITATYPGATPQTMNDGVVELIERELSGTKRLLYFESSTDTSGSATITATFQPGTNPELALVDVQNRLKLIEPRLPQTVRQYGLAVEVANSGFLLLVGLNSPDGRYDEAALGDYLARNIVNELKRIPGVGRVQSFSAEKAMRVWVDPAKLIAYDLAMADVTGAIAAQNIQIAPGTLGAEPAVAGQRVLVPLTASGQLTSPQEFEQIVLKANTNGGTVTLGDVARVEVGQQNYMMSTRENGRAGASAAVQLAPGANAVQVSDAVRARMAEIGRAMPGGMEWTVPFDTAPFVRVSIEKVLHTLVEAMVLVFLVMYLFLQNMRYTLVPAVVAPIALLGTIAVMSLAGYSLNVLTMFGMVLAIGIIVDDAIVVVENVERIMAEEGLSPFEATKKAMREITGAVIGITLVLVSVFIPMAFASGSVGVIYRQFAMSMAISILISAVLALSLTPALCATVLKPIKGHVQKPRFFAAFDRMFERMTDGYAGWVARVIRRGGRAMVALGVVVALLGFAFWRLPTAFMPEEDQGYYMTAFQLPADATAERTREAVQVLERHTATRPSTKGNEAILGFGFSGAGPNAAIVFTVLKDWGERGGATVKDEVARTMAAMSTIKEGIIMSLVPPAIDELGNSSGFAMRLEDRAGRGHDALVAAQYQLLGLAGQSKKVVGVYPDGLPAGTSIHLSIDRQKAEALGVPFNRISDTLSAAMGSAYVGDYPNAGRMQQVIVQADAAYRMNLPDMMRLNLRNNAGSMVPLSEVVRADWEQTPLQLVRYNGYPALRLSGMAAPGVSSGDAMAEMAALAKQLPPGFAIEWTGLSYQEQQSGAQAPMLLALSMLAVFLVLAAMYDSFAVPLAVMLVVPLGLIGAVTAVSIRGMANDVFFKVGLITIIGLSAKNAILIVEFARHYRESGMGLVESAMAAARVRLRPIVMTSLAFTLGVVPLMLSSGASAETQSAIGTGVFGGMISGTVLAVFFVPVFFVVAMGLSERLGFGGLRRKKTKQEQADA
ncbi:multidrug efflux RND transporter permease subunit [Novosphingobium sp. KACC 22771]|uniref:multidrug efflux RND transporter permease subunit n=1 Tax=Novosphingobium sp. KACC 22771 TaxID=3025670 RepID=UPI0023651666|nr:multidrug efflux RND transporter permease subunit [Novosphingobium sp. KACC 22771]WDF75297.1 multidrug efflux RND transporter permease subunit [Novosphingobium sp. KACC 22771]